MAPVGGRGWRSTRRTRSWRRRSARSRGRSSSRPAARRPPISASREPPGPGKAEGHRILTSAVEHDATLNALQHLEKFGFEVVVLPVDRYGRLDPETLDAALDERTILVALQAANNEIGTIQPLKDLIATVRRVRGRKTLVYVDAVQGAPYLDLDVRPARRRPGGHRRPQVRRPKGMGALWVRGGTAIMAQTHGGGQERYRRAGTENVAGAVGMATALRLNAAERRETVRRLRRLRDRLRAALASDPAVEFTGHPTERLPGHLSLLVRGVEGAAIVVALDLEGIAASAGAACTTGSPEVSHVLTAMGYPDEEARGALRLSLGRTTTEAEIDQAVEVVPAVIARLRDGSTALAADPLGQEIGV